MSLNVNLPKGYAETVANAIRQTVFCKRNVLRPIAVQVGHESNVLSMGAQVLEDMTEFTSHLLDYNYVVREETLPGSLIIVETDCTGVVTLADLVGDKVTVLGAPSSEEMLHLVQGDEPVKISVKVYYRYDCGSFSIQDNEYFLKDTLDSLTNVVVLNSRHNDVDTFTYQINKDNLRTDTVKFTGKSKIGTSDVEITKEAIDVLIDTLQSIKASI